MIIALVTALAVAAGPAPANQICLGALGDVLRRVAFSGSLDCVRDKLTAKRVGEIGVRGHRFEVYDYRYSLAPACVGCAVRGGQRIIVLRDGRYLGQYNPDTVNLRVRADRLVLTPENGPATSIRFTSAGPPQSIRVDGDPHIFFK